MFVQVILPVFLIFALGYVGQKRLRLDVRSLSTASLYLMSPLLVFRTLYAADIDRQYIYVTVYSLALCLILIGCVKITSRIRGYTRSEESGLILATAFMNNGNLGVPVILFAFGQAGLHYAIVIMVVQTILMSTLGVYYAAKGSAVGGQAISSVVKMPIIHAALLGLSWNAWGWEVPRSLLQVIDFVADAAIPTIMLALGMQLAEIPLNRLDWEKVGFSLLSRLILSPVIAWFIATWLPVDPLLKQVMVVAAAMPSAANTTMYSLQFGSEPKLVSGITLLSTVISAVSLTVVLGMLR
ncbi:AEC family transporter [Polycladomyces subterraneus]|uniref:AEC family transporter n=1 Tax=Polycladomyces subterraneus TaxID=1016997 RepID=A0ABT8IKM4_9BACL|nr:AEC family transporter [Polycladomyces subterraneus]MDN4593330.1 AEC family transporter [Polycladomyces subterraneus]